MKRSIILALCLGGCGAADTTTTTPVTEFVPLPTGSAVYSGSLAKVTTTNTANYTEVKTVGGSITLGANFATGGLSVSVTNPRIDVARTSPQSTDAQNNFFEEITYSGTASGLGTVTGTSFSANLSGILTPTSVDRIPLIGAAPEAFTGSIAGQVTGSNYTSAVGTVSLGRPVSGQTVPLFVDQEFNVSRN